MDVSLWISFTLVIVLALYIDVSFTQRYPKRAASASLRASLIWTIVWIALALSFNLFFWFYQYINYGAAIAHQQALDFLTGYLIEKSLSVDNLFVFYMIFSELHIPIAYQKRVFTYGIVGAIIMRLVMILLGSILIQRYHWLIYVFGGFLLLTGFKMLLLQEQKKVLTESSLYCWMQRHLRLSHELHDQSFIIKKNGRWFLTRLFIALVFIEISDLIFAFDSIPAIFAITRDPFIIWSSNVFAILGLRSLYFLLAGMVEKLRLLKYGIALILMFVGFKMIIEWWLPISTLISLLVVTSILFIFIILSWWQVHKENIRKL